MTSVWRKAGYLNLMNRKYLGLLNAIVIVVAFVLTEMGIFTFRYTMPCIVALLAVISLMYIRRNQS